MRIVSQDGTIDLPYELVGLSLGKKCDNSIYYIYAHSQVIDLKNCHMAKYSTEEKAIKVMKMVREACNKRSLMEMTYSDGNLSKLCKTIGEEELADICSNVFQFPKDDEIEV